MARTAQQLTMALIVLAAAILFTTGVNTTGEAGRLEIHNINIAQADSTLIVGPGGRSLLIDSGETGWNSHRNADRITEYVSNALNCRTVDYFLVTHYHNDHIGYASDPPKGGIRWLVEQESFTFRTFIDRGYEDFGTATNTFFHYRDWMSQLKNRCRAVTGTGLIDLGGGVLVNIVALNGNGVIPAGDQSKVKAPPSENDYSICVKVSYGPFDYFIGGDLSGETVQSRFGYMYNDIETSVAPLVGNIEVLHVNHHGSSHSSNQFFVDTLDPEAAVLSYGLNNRYGHPDAAVVDRLKATADLFQTAVDGDIVIASSGGDTYTVSCSEGVGRTYRCDENVPPAKAVPSPASTTPAPATPSPSPGTSSPNAAKTPVPDATKTPAPATPSPTPGTSSPNAAKTPVPDTTKTPAPASTKEAGAVESPAPAGAPAALDVSATEILSGACTGGICTDLSRKDGARLAFTAAEGAGKGYRKGRYYVDFTASFEPSGEVPPTSLAVVFSATASPPSSLSVMYRSKATGKWKTLKSRKLSAKDAVYTVPLAEAISDMEDPGKITLRFRISSPRPELTLQVDSLQLVSDIDNDG